MFASGFCDFGSRMYLKIQSRVCSGRAATLPRSGAFFLISPGAAPMVWHLGEYPSMKIKQWLGVMIVAAWLNGAAGYAQQSVNQPIYPAPSPLAPEAAPERRPEAILPSGGVLSDWITYRRECCEGAEAR